MGYWVIGLTAVAVIGLVWLAIQGRLGGMPPLVDDRPGPDLPPGALTGFDVRSARFATTARGYSMPQVDALLERVACELDGTPFVPLDELEMWAAGHTEAGIVGATRPQEGVPSAAADTGIPGAIRRTGLGWPAGM